MYPAHRRIWQADYDAYAGGLAAFVRYRLPAAEAEDTLQDVWEAYALALETNTPVAQARAWLYRVARNRIADRYRRGPRLTELPAGDELPYLADPDWFGADDAEAPLGAAELRRALAELPAAQREVFERNVLGGETLREIAEDLGAPLKTIISRKGYARRRLRDVLGETFSGPD